MNLMKKILSGVLACAIAVPFSNCVFADVVKLKGINVERRGLGATYEIRVTVENPKPTLQYKFSLEFDGMRFMIADFSERDTCVCNAVFNGNHKVIVEVIDTDKEKPLEEASDVVDRNLNVGYGMADQSGFKDKKVTLENPENACFLNAIMQQVYNIPVLKNSFKDCKIVEKMCEVRKKLNLLKEILEKINFTNLEEESDWKNNILEQKNTLIQAIDGFNSSFENGSLSEVCIENFLEILSSFADPLNTSFTDLYEQQISKLEGSTLEDEVWQKVPIDDLNRKIREVHESLNEFRQKFTLENKVALFTYILMQIMDKSEVKSKVAVGEIYKNMGLYKDETEDPIVAFAKFNSVFQEICAAWEMADVNECSCIADVRSDDFRNKPIGVVSFGGLAAVKRDFETEYANLFAGKQDITFENGSQKELKGFIVSSQDSGGHYYSFVKGKSGDWYCLNDGSVTRFDSFDEVLNCCAHQGLHFSMAFFVSK